MKMNLLPKNRWRMAKAQPEPQEGPPIEPEESVKTTDGDESTTTSFRLGGRQEAFNAELIALGAGLQLIVERGEEELHGLHQYIVTPPDQVKTRRYSRYG